jgi:PAS domain S-box-containing protein
MSWRPTIVAIAPLLVCACSLPLASHVWPKRGRRRVLAFAALSFAAGIWCFRYIAEVPAGTLWSEVLRSKVEGLGLAVPGALMLLALFGAESLAAGTARETVIESVSDGLLALDHEGRVIDANPAAERMLGHRGEEMVGQLLDRALPEHPALAAYYREAISVQDKAVQRDGTTLKLAYAAGGEDEHRHYAVSVVELPLPAARAPGHLVILRDVTPQVRTGEALRAQQELFRGLVAVARATAERPSLHDTLNDVLITCARVTEAEYGTLLTFDERGHALRDLVLSARGTIESQTTLDDEAATIWFTWATQHHEPVIAADIGRSPYLPSLTRQVPDARSALIVPIVSGLMSLGVLSLIHSSVGHFTADHAHLMRAAGDQLGLALRNARYFDTQQRVAEHQSTLFHVLRSVANQRDPENVMHTAVQSVAQFAGWHHVGDRCVGGGAAPR